MVSVNLARQNSLSEFADGMDYQVRPQIQFNFIYVYYIY